jgi:hypothetical protein
MLLLLSPGPTPLLCSAGVGTGGYCGIFSSLCGLVAGIYFWQPRKYGKSPEISCVQDMLTEKNVIMHGPLYTLLLPHLVVYMSISYS